MSKKSSLKFKIKTLGLHMVLGHMVPAYYSLFKNRPIDENKVIFIENRYDKLSNNFDLIYKRLENDGSFVLHTHLLRQLFVGNIEYFKRCFKLAKDMATAKYIFICEGCRITGRIKTRPETKIFNVWHACGAIKKFGFSLDDKEYGGSGEEMRYFNMYRANYASISSEGMLDIFEEAFGVSEENPLKVLPIGMSRSDIYFDDERIKLARERITRLVPAANEKKILLYSPTFRGETSAAQAPDSPDYELLRKNFSDEYILLINHHPMIKNLPEIPESCRDFAFDVSRTADSDDVLMAADICITDYSSIVNDYILLDRPILLYAPDHISFNKSRGMYYDYATGSPGPVLVSTEELIDSIRNISDFDMDKMRTYRDWQMKNCDGHSTDRILKVMFGDREIKPLTAGKEQP